MIAKIVVPQGDGLTKTQGTQVWVGDQQLTGVVKIELIAEVGDVWRAVVHCHVQPPAELLAELEVKCCTPTTS